ncbi:MAG: peptidoglycan DD-metalloendopeptidase family protein, partial [Lachnospiraceae bacterium]|nr:peptidoglycan DD-metalloendopeptidase family protein [Lachnospiraceae bacterium]
MKKLKRVLLGLMAFVIMVAGISHVSFATELSEAEKEKQRLEQRKEEVEKELTELELEKNSLADNIEKLDKKVEKTNQKLEEVNANLEKVNKELEQITMELEEAEALEEKQYETMKKRIKYMYENGSTDYVDIVLSSKSFGELLNRVEYVNKITNYDNQMYKEFKDTKLMVLNKKNEVSNKKQQYEILQEEVELEQGTLEELLEKKQSEMDKYNSSIENASKEMQKYIEEIAKKEEEINKLLLEQAKKEGYTVIGELADEYGFCWPMSVKGTITSRFGPRKSPTPGASTYHKGIDIAAPTGVSILAAKGGTVVTSKYSSSAGNYIMINHGNGVYTVYMHAS